MNRTLTLTSPHMQGPDVTRAQELLRGADYYTGDVDGDFGPLSAQASHRAQFWLGYAAPKQTFGPQLERLLSGEAQPSPAAKKRMAERKKAAGKKKLRLKALDEMRKLVGIVESPSGSDTPVNTWYGASGPWCAMTVTMAYVKAGSSGFARGSRFSYVPTIVAAARAGQNGLTVTTNPQPGDLVCFDWDGSNFAGSKNHVGMFEERTGPSSFRTIEGNHNDRCERVDRTMSVAPRIVFVHAAK